MNFFTKLYARTYQTIFYFMSFFINFREPETLLGHDKLFQLPDLLTKLGKKKALLVTDSTILKLGLLDSLMKSFVLKFFPFAVYSDVVANPTIQNVEDGLKVYQEEGCDCLIAVGGGSSIDCAKCIAARSSNPKKSIAKMRGVLKVTHKLPLLIAVPTTAGTGSEATVAAVVVDKNNNDKYSINDPKLIPAYAVFDFTLIEKAPKSIVATTGMDALTHAVEAFIGRSNTPKTTKYAYSAVKLIFENLTKAVNETDNVLYRANMQMASYQAGVAFTRAYVGTVHALAHSLGGFYNVPHGYANAVILPFVLKQYGRSVTRKLAKLADIVGVPSKMNKKEKAQWFIQQIEQMNKNIGITNTLKDIIKTEDIPALAKHAYCESVPLYPTPKMFTKKELETLYLQIINY
ncbi:MAG: iron-containing alcohol dehydrogenase [Bacilli bacterium]